MRAAVLLSSVVAAVVGHVRESPWSMDDAPQGDLGFQLLAAPPVVDLGGDVVISWKGLATPHAKDYVTLSCGPTNGPDDFIALRNVTGRSVRFEDLHMLRCVYDVHYFHFSDATQAWAPLGDVAVPLCDSINAPLQGHLSFNDAVDEMAITFNSASNATPHVRYSTSPSLDSFRLQSGTSTTYAASDMCHAPANTVAQRWFRSPGYFHTVVMTGLAPATEYFYQYGNDADGWSSVRSFVSRVPAGAANATVSFIAYGDMGVDDAPAGWSTSLRVFEDIVARDYKSFLLHFGDISYARGLGLQWDKYFGLIEPVATRIPYMASIGNHEFDYTSGGEHDPSHFEMFHPSWGNYGSDSSGECGVPMVHRFHSPTNGHGLFWYSFDYGVVTVIQMSSEHDFLPGSVQYKWLEKTLRGINRTATPWVVLTAHRMMYTTQVGEDADLKVSLHFRAAVEPLLRQYKVNLVLVGHQHSYERSCPVLEGNCVDQGPVHIVVGSAGAEVERGEFSDKIGKWSVAHINAYGYLRIRASATEMHVAFVLNANGNVYDQVTLQPWA